MTDVVLKVTKYTDGTGRNSGWATSKRPMWAAGVVEPAAQGGFDDEVVLLCLIEPDNVGDRIVLLHDLDEYVIVDDPEEWPEEVCVAVALRAMGVSDGLA
jgi:hypothetical protein